MDYFCYNKTLILAHLGLEQSQCLFKSTKLEQIPRSPKRNPECCEKNGGGVKF